MNSDPGIDGVGIQSDARTTREDIIAMFNRRQQAWEDLDASALAADYADDVVIESPFAGTHRGRAAAEQALRAIFTAFVDAKLSTEDVIVDGSRVAHVMTGEGTHMGEFLGIAPTGKAFRLRFVCIHDVEDGRIVRERRIYDFTGLLMQIGVLKARPG
jgi:steroid delta-isomerase-like uncharacterized protein